MVSDTESPHLDITWSTSAQVKSLAIVSAFLLLYVIGWVSGFLSPVLGLFGVVTFGGIIGLSGSTWWRSRHVSWMLRLDPAGVTVRDCPRTPWSDLAEVRVSLMRPRWLFWASLRPMKVVAFIPNPGIELASIRSPGQPSFRWQRTMGRNLYGTPLAVLATATTASADEILTAVEQFGQGTPVKNRLA